MKKRILIPLIIVFSVSMLFVDLNTPGLFPWISIAFSYPNSSLDHFGPTPESRELWEAVRDCAGDSRIMTTYRAKREGYQLENFGTASFLANLKMIRLNGDTMQIGFLVYVPEHRETLEELHQCYGKIRKN